MENIPNQEQVRKIFKDTYSIYKLYNNYILFKTMINLLPLVEPEQAKDIMSEVYVFYQKHKNVYYDDEWCELCEEAKAINQKHNNNDFCRGVLVELLNLLEEQYAGTKKKNS